jgi:ubiquinone/menaquinone biosynthesis C-methylase UbiE
VKSCYDDVFTPDPIYQEQLENILEFIDKKPAKVLDVGAGTGNLLEMIAEKYPDSLVYGIDNDSDMVRTATRKYSEKNNINISVGDATKLQYGDGYFDFVVSNWAIHHLDNEEKRAFAKEAFRVLSDSGRLVLGDIFSSVNGKAGDVERSVSLIQSIVKRAIYYLRNVSFERALVLIAALPDFLTNNGEHLVTANDMSCLLEEAGFRELTIKNTSDPEYMVRIIVADKNHQSCQERG